MYFIRNDLIFYIFLVHILIQKVVGNMYDLTKVTPIELTAVGRVANLGELYDARSDQFLHLSILKSALPVSSITSVHNKQTKLKYTFSNTMEEKFSTMDISASLKLSILGGLFKLEGSGKFFKDTKKSAKSAKVSLINSISTEYEQISITDSSIQPLINFDALEQIDATHVVVGIQWGGSVFVSVEDTNEANADQQRVQGNLKAKLTILAATISGKALVDVNEQEQNELSKFNFEIYGDILPDEVPQNLFDALRFMRNVSKSLQNANNGKGKAMKYTLIPINLLRKMLKIKAKINSILNNIDESTVRQCVKLFDDINKIEQKLNDLVGYVQHYETHISTKTVDDLKTVQFNYQIYQSKVQKELAEHLVLVRSGNESATVLHDTMIESIEHPFSSKNVYSSLMANSTKIKEEISFLKYLVNMNITLLDKENTLDMFLYDYPKNDVYILCYSEPNSKLIGKPMDIILTLIEIKKNNGTTDIFAAVNNEIYNLGNDSQLRYYRNMKLVTENFEESWTTPDGNETDLWSISYMQNQLIRVRNQLEHHSKNIRDNTLPIGFIYTQLPNTLEPQQLWPLFQWVDITKEYGGQFFRAEGGGSLPFGQTQQADNPRLIQVKTLSMCDISRNRISGREGGMAIPPGSWSEDAVRDIGSCANYRLHFLVSNVENRPINTAIRFWNNTGL